jgi:hypothetical protein
MCSLRNPWPTCLASHHPIGGYEFAWQDRSFPFINGAGYNYPGFYNNQTFSERVQKQANYPVQY